MGTLTRNTARQLQLVRMMPPTMGPTSAPSGKMLENKPRARWRFWPKTSMTIPLAAGMKAAPPAAWRTRKPISISMLVANPQSSELVVNNMAAPTNTRLRPRLSATRPAMGMATTMPSW